MLAVLERIEKEDKQIRENCVNKAKLDIVKEMIKENIEINKICKCTKISKKEVEKIRKELKRA